MKTNLTLMRIADGVEYVAVRGGAECLTPYADEDGMPIIGWAAIVQRLGEEHLSAVLLDPPTHELIPHAEVDISGACWDKEYYKRIHRGRQSNSRNKQRLRAARAKALLEPEDDDLPF